jgi:DNA-binding CsgD family transcriptional regulator
VNQGPDLHGSCYGSVDLRGTNYNTSALVSTLETLLRKLPNPDAALRTSSLRRRPARPGRLNAKQVQQLVDGYEAGATTYQLGDRFGIDRRTVTAILKHHGVRMRRQGLSPDQIAEAVQLRAAGWTLPQIGKRFGVGTSTVKRRLAELRRAD